MLRYDSLLFSKNLISYFHIVDDKNVYFGVESKIDEIEINNKRTTRVESSSPNHRCNSVSNETSLTLAFA